MLLRIYDVKDFPVHTGLLEIRKGYFMEPENKFATAEERKKRRRRGRRRVEEWIELCSIKSSANKEISRGLGKAFKEK